ncbi:MAG: hypothetical protein HY904_22645 [Deltaproteobacteria bacterium]|nr:hypothetical protein [Deltaproteobacteria bacterium]
MRRFVCDGTLGALCRWLRAAGHDTAFLGPVRRVRRDEPAQADSLLECAVREERLVLTRSPRVAERLGPRAHLVQDDVVFHQILEVSRALDLSLVKHALTRCREDNTPLVPVDPQAARGRVPPYVAATQHSFVGCPSCGRVYWGATHRDSMLQRLEELEALRTAVSQVAPPRPPAEAAPPWPAPLGHGTATAARRRPP